MESHTNRIMAPAPLFDHENSLLNFIGTDALTDKDSVWTYAGTQLSCVYDDYVSEAKDVLTHEQRNSLRKLLDFCFQRHSRYNLDPKRLKLIEYAVQRRTAELLEE